MGIMDKSTIEQWILPFLPAGRCGFKITAPVIEVVECVLYRLKTGCQWRQLPLHAFFRGDVVLSWESVFYHFNKWCKRGYWKAIWINLLKENKSHLDLSSAALDGSHTPAKNGGDAVGYQGRKSTDTTNALFLTDSQGVILAMSEPQAGQHHDLFCNQELFNQLCDIAKEAGIDLSGVFLNADPGFDSATLKQACEEKEIILNVKENKRNKKQGGEESYEDGTHVFDDILYEKRFVVEQANAWIDGFKALLVRFEFSSRNWMNLHFLAFCVIFLRKINQKSKV